jgi:hypothetical protein
LGTSNESLSLSGTNEKSSFGECEAAHVGGLVVFGEAVDGGDALNASRPAN